MILGGSAADRYFEDIGQNVYWRLGQARRSDITPPRQQQNLSQYMNMPEMLPRLKFCKLAILSTRWAAHCPDVISPAEKVIGDMASKYQHFDAQHCLNKVRVHEYGS